MLSLILYLRCCPRIKKLNRTWTTDNNAIDLQSVVLGLVGHHYHRAFCDLWLECGVYKVIYICHRDVKLDASMFKFIHIFLEQQHFFHFIIYKLWITTGLLFHVIKSRQSNDLNPSMTHMSNHSRKSNVLVFHWTTVWKARSLISSPVKLISVSYYYCRPKLRLLNSLRQS